MAKNHHPKYKFILAANRDEFYKRPTDKCQWWNDKPNLLAGKDLEAGGTWLGINKNGRISFLTNIRDLGSLKDNAKTRGKLVLDFLTSEENSKKYLSSILTDSNSYNGFNLITGNVDEMHHINSVEGKIVKIKDGIHVLSNANLNTPWPKAQLGISKFKEIIENENIDKMKLFNLLQNNIKADDSILPETGIGLKWERILSSIFIKTEHYGTRVSTLLLVDYNNQVYMKEYTHLNNSSTEFEFKIQS